MGSVVLGCLLENTSGSDSLSALDAGTIVHEIGHALGLSHPYEIRQMATGILTIQYVLQHQSRWLGF